MVKLMGRAAGTIAAAALATGATLMFAPTAHAGTSSGQATCPVPKEIQGAMNNQTELKGPQAYTVTGPATAAPGSDVELNVDLGPSPAEVPLDVSGAKLTPTVQFKASGASTAPISAKASTIEMDLKKGGIDLPAFKVKVKVPSGSGKLDLAPDKLTLDINAMGVTLQMVCTTTGAGVVHSITLSGGSTGGTTSGTTSTTGGTTSTSSGSSSTSSGGAAASSSSGSSTGSLPKTGPLDDALSMGLVGGTVGLLGIGAVLVATRKVRASRNTTA
ncbi:hypothetical protein [Yinghuangia sp. YIM S09857]|uniref:hypothetical protein n=1 Tax=Yinghuangia sp. YIM S09857 TaxID=3436929 RepID=UPI003F52D2C0